MTSLEFSVQSDSFGQFMPDATDGQPRRWRRGQKRTARDRHRSRDAVARLHAASIRYTPPDFSGSTIHERMKLMAMEISSFFARVPLKYMGTP